MSQRRRSGGDILRLVLRLLTDTVRAWLPNREVTRSEAGIPTDADHRREQLAKVGSQAWLRLRVMRARSRRAGDDDRRRLREDALVRTAKDAYEVLGDMKGAMMKLAQFVSFEPGLPSSVREQLKGLQTSAPPMASELVATCITRELGAPPNEIFARFDATPIASASIGQVHRARTHQGAEVAVKVQYPGVAEAISADLANAGTFIETMTAALQRDADFSAHLEEVAARVGEELDYRTEAANQRWFADRYRGHPFVRIPEVLPELSSEQVLCTGFVEGVGFYDVLEGRVFDGPQEVRDELGEIIFRFAFTSVFADGIFSGDPHPGNYLFCADGRVCFLDFGLVKRVTDDERALLRAPMAAVVEGDREGLRRSLVDLGVLDPSTPVDLQALWDLFVIMLGPVHEDRRVRCTIEAAQEDRRIRREVRRELLEHLDLPPAVMFFQRYRRGTWSVLAHLGAEANWHRIMREILFDDPPSTELGHAWARSVPR